MATNKNAVVRYMYLDELLSDSHRMYTRGELCDKCNERLAQNGYETICKRSIEKDLHAIENDPFYMELEKTVEDGKELVGYKDPTNTIFSKALTADDKRLLKEVLNTLGQFSGLDNFEWLGEMQEKLNDKKAFGGKGVKESYQTTTPAIQFSTNEFLKNKDYLGKLFAAITNKIVITIGYQKFNTDEPKEFTVYPYLLKQYNERWYLVCNSVGTEEYKYDPEFVMVLPLDRMTAIIERPTLKYKECKVDLDDWFYDIVGITNRREVNAGPIVFAVRNSEAPYLETKPIHGSQMPFFPEQEEMHRKYPMLDDFKFFKIKSCKVNEELKRIFYRFGNDLVVIEPIGLAIELAERARKQQQISSAVVERSKQICKSCE